MKSKLMKAALLMSSALAVSALATSASALRPGNYNVQGIQRICVQSGGTWYGETFGPWSGDYKTGPTGQTALYGNANSGTDNDSFIIKNGSSQWTEWKDDLSYSFFAVGAFGRIGSRCGPPAAQATPGHKNPTD